MALIDERIESAQLAIASAKESRDNETKSSVGDKYETGRTIIQFEVEKYQNQYQQSIHQRNIVAKINTQKEFLKTELGAIITTNDKLYFLSIPFGKISIKGSNVFCISPVSPLGKLLINKKLGDEIVFQGETIKIKEIE
jgi:hypothetical protein